MSLLRKAGKFNNIPEELMPKLPPIGTVVAFNMSHFTVDKNGVKRYSEHFTLKPQSVLINPENGEMIHIALVDNVDDRGGVSQFRKLVTKPQFNGGCHRITIGHDADSNDIYRFLMLSSQNGSNPNRIESEEVAYTYHDAIGEAKSNSAARKAKREALVFVDNLKDTELNSLAMILDIPTGDPDVMRDAIEAYADKEPADFLLKAKSDDSETVALIKKALKLDVVYRDGVDLKWRLGDGKIVTLTDANSGVVVGEFVNYVKTREVGAVIISKMRELVLTAEAKENKPKAGRPAKV